MRHLPLAIVRGPIAAMPAAVATGLARDVYPDEAIQLLRHRVVRRHGRGRHPRRRVHRQGRDGRRRRLRLRRQPPRSRRPRQPQREARVGRVRQHRARTRRTPSSCPSSSRRTRNTDLGSGHGTHVAGIIAADGTTSPAHLGVAPDAELVCLSIGEVLFTTAVVTAYDYLLDQPDLWGVDVVNNSWGNLYAQFDPRNPVAVATKAIADLGVTVVFAAGNAGDGNGEAHPQPVQPVPVGALGRGRDRRPRAWRLLVQRPPLRQQHRGRPRPGGPHDVHRRAHRRWCHPDVAAPGVDISSSCDTARRRRRARARRARTPTASGTSHGVAPRRRRGRRPPPGQPRRSRRPSSQRSSRPPPSPVRSRRRRRRSRDRHSARSGRSATAGSTWPPPSPRPAARPRMPAARAPSSGTQRRGAGRAPATASCATTSRPGTRPRLTVGTDVRSFTGRARCRTPPT